MHHLQPNRKGDSSIFPRSTIDCYPEASNCMSTAALFRNEKELVNYAAKYIKHAIWILFSHPLQSLSEGKSNQRATQQVIDQIDRRKLASQEKSETDSPPVYYAAMLHYEGSHFKLLNTVNNQLFRIDSSSIPNSEGHIRTKPGKSLQQNHQKVILANWIIQPTIKSKPATSVCERDVQMKIRRTATRILRIKNETSRTSNEQYAQ